jgi:hypothetical protein
MAVSGEIAQVAASASSVLSLGAVVGGLAAISKLSAMRIEARVDEAIKKAESYGIDLSDLYYDFDVPVGLRRHRLRQNATFKTRTLRFCGGVT